MKFPLSVEANINSHEGNFSRKLELRSDLTFIVGPNGSGKTHLLKGLKYSFTAYTDKKVCFISAGRLGPMEQYRSKYDKYYYSNDYIDQITHGDKECSAQRHEIETITGNFHTLSTRPDILIKVRERLQKLFKRNINIDWDAGNLKVSFSRLGQGHTYYSSGREASGLLHLVGILSALYDDEVGVLLIDEPEVSLHPQLQAFLLKEISRVAGVPDENSYQKLIIMATHSTEMIKISRAEDLLSFIFCNDLKEEPIQIPENAGELKNNKVKSLVARLGQEHKLALFSKTPLLVEGPSDVIICNTLSDKLHLNLEAAGSQILPINGKDAMPETVKLFRLMGKAPTVLVDADAFADNLNLVNAYFNNEIIKNQADNLASKDGTLDILKKTKDIHDALCLSVGENWANISQIAENHPYFKVTENEELKKRRATLCYLFNHSPETDKLNRLQASLNSLFSLFEKMGLFILKKGAIESYYSDKNAMIDKVDDAINESEHIFNSPEENIINSYTDVLNCLKYASNSEAIDESRAIRDELLSLVAPIHARYAEGETNLDNLGRSSLIFNFHINDNGKLEISMNSKVLNVNGFPIILDKNDDVRIRVNQQLGL